MVSGSVQTPVCGLPQGPALTVCVLLGPSPLFSCPLCPPFPQHLDEKPKQEAKAWREPLCLTFMGAGSHFSRTIVLN